MTIHISLATLESVLAITIGVLILVKPHLTARLIAVYLIIVGLLGIFR